jgi:ElaB/YqjD/DUF883 family membrane-anchored ribosome-binding protein
MHKDIRNSTERIAADVQALLGDAEGLLRAVSGASGEAVEVARGRIQQRVDALRNGLEQGREAALSEARHAASRADRYVHDNPWPVIGVALAAGVVIGLLGRRGIDAAAAGLH